jgi:hypothetical protein
MADTPRWGGNLQRTAKFGDLFDWRSVLFSVCLMFALTNAAQAEGLQSRQADAQAGYLHIPARLEVLACSDPDQQADCKFYFAGFAHTLDLIFAADPKGDAGDGLCGDISDLIYEFEHEVQTNPKARSAETPTVLAMLLIRNHNCAKLKGQDHIQSGLSAGELIDVCHAGDT